MFSWVFSGSLGDILAPIPNLGARFESFIHRERFAEAQELIVELAAHKDINECCINGQNYLHIAAAAGATDVVITLVTHGADVNFPSTMGNTALHFASKVNHANVVEFLLRCGADPTIANQAGHTAADLTTDVRLKALLQQGHLNAEPITELKDNAPSTPPHRYIRAATDKMTTPQTRTHATATTPNARKARTVHFSRYGTPVVGTPHTHIDDDDLKAAVLRAATETAQAFKARDHEWKLTKQMFDTVTKWTAQNSEASRQALLNLLETKPEIVHARACQMGTIHDGFTPLHAAAQRGNVEAITILCEHGNADPWARDLQGRTALHLATKGAHETSCEVLRAIMRAQRIDPVGEHAPVDLTGSTPLAVLQRPIPQLTQALFKPGDRAILPSTPWELRSGTTYEVQVQFAHAGAQNFCDYMEDRLVCVCPISEEEHVCIFGVFDGHGGTFTADFLCSNISRKLLATPSWQTGHRDAATLAEALRQACIDADNELREQPQMKLHRIETRSKTGDEEAVKVKYQAGDSSGSTGNIVLVTPTHIVVANVGDSRAVLGTRAEAEECRSVQLSEDHKLTLPAELERIQLAEGMVTAEQANRVNRFKPHAAETHTVHRVKSKISDISLAMSRSFGDFVMKANPGLPLESQIVIAVPDIQIHERRAEDELLIIGSDGVWDALSNDDAVRIAYQHIRSSEGSDPVNNSPMQQMHPSSPTHIFPQDDEAEEIAGTSLQQHRCAQATDALLEAALRGGSTDNMVAIVVDLRPSISGSPIIGKRLFD